MEWIDIKKQKPEYEQPVFVCEVNNEDSVGIARLNSITTSKGHESIEWYEGRSSYDTWYQEVTHWSPLRCATK